MQAPSRREHFIAKLLTILSMHQVLTVDHLPWPKKENYQYLLRHFTTLVQSDFTLTASGPAETAPALISVVPVAIPEA